MKQTIDIDLSEGDRLAIANGLSGLLADTYTLYQDRLDAALDDQPKQR